MKDAHRQYYVKRNVYYPSHNSRQLKIKKIVEWFHIDYRNNTLNFPSTIHELNYLWFELFLFANTR
jgi:hypothetical protein